MKPSAHARRGFTMMELALVIAIIGLLVGGLAGFRSYTQNAKLNTMMNEGQFYIDGFNQFQQRYVAIPGDFNTASTNWSGAGNGDGNGLIRATGTAPGNEAERLYSFQHLALAGFIPGSYSGATVGGVGTFHAKIGINVPGSVFGRAAFLFDHPTETDGFISGGAGGADALYFDGHYGHMLRIAGLNDSDTNIPRNAILTPRQALKLDDKYDNGLPGQGRITTPISTALANCATSAVATSAAYDISNGDAVSCYLFLRMQ